MSEINPILPFLCIVRIDQEPGKAPGFFMEFRMAADQIIATALGWGDIAKIVLASGVVAALIGWIKDWFFRSTDTSKAAKFAAIGVVGKLDEYAHRSSQRISSYREETAQLQPHVHYLNWPTCSYPELSVDQELLKLIDTELACEVAWFATTQAHASEYVYYIYEHSADPTEGRDAQAELVGFMGYEAYELATKIRNRYGLLKYAHRWDLAGEFNDLQRDWKKVKNDLSIRLARRNPAE